MKDFSITARFGRGRKCHIKEWRFKTREGAVLFCKIFLLHNPRCANYTVHDF